MTICPICLSDKQSTLCKVSFTYNSEFDLSECVKCHVIFCNPTPTTKQFVDFYSSGSYDFNRWKQESKAEAYIKRLNKKQKTGKILDIGCATAYMINKISQDSDWDVYGVELSKKPVEFARNSLNLKNIVHGDLFSAKYDNNFFDCINISDVLEHVSNPVDFLIECHRILKPDGHIYLGVPNGHNDSRGLIKYYNQTLKPGCHASGHVFFFQKQTLLYLFEKVGFDVLQSNTTHFKNGLRNLGLIPQKQNWKDFYQPQGISKVAIESDIEIKLITEKKYPSFYYRYRYLKNNWLVIPGLHNAGLDFNFLLTPSKCDKKT